MRHMLVSQDEHLAMRLCRPPTPGISIGPARTQANVIAQIATLPKYGHSLVIDAECLLLSTTIFVLQRRGETYRGTQITRGAESAFEVMRVSCRFITLVTSY